MEGDSCRWGTIPLQPLNLAENPGRCSSPLWASHPWFEQGLTVDAIISRYLWRGQRNVVSLPSTEHMSFATGQVLACFSPCFLPTMARMLLPYTQWHSDDEGRIPEWHRKSPYEQTWGHKDTKDYFFIGPSPTRRWRLRGNPGSLSGRCWLLYNIPVITYDSGSITVRQGRDWDANVH